MGPKRPVEDEGGRERDGGWSCVMELYSEGVYIAFFCSHTSPILPVKLGMLSFL